jgi:hypothetical protein
MLVVTAFRRLGLFESGGNGDDLSGMICIQRLHPPQLCSRRVIARLSCLSPDDEIDLHFGRRNHSMSYKRGGGC